MTASKSMLALPVEGCNWVYWPPRASGEVLKNREPTLMFAELLTVETMSSGKETGAVAANV